MEVGKTQKNFGMNTDGGKMVNVGFLDWVIDGYEDMYCDGWIDGWNARNDAENKQTPIADIIPWHDGNYYCSICGGIIDPVFDYCCHCGSILDLGGIL